MSTGSMFRVPCSRFVFGVPVLGFLVLGFPVLGFLVLGFLVLGFPVPCQAQEMAPLRPGLLAVPMPALDGLEPAVAAQLREQRTALEVVASRASVADRDLASAYGALGRLCHAYEWFDAAEASYANAIRLAPQDAASLHLLGYLYQQTGRFEEALDRYAGARRAKPNDPVVRVHLAEVHLQVNRLAEARQLFEDLIDIFPAVARAGLGEIALREGRLRDAVRHLEAALDRAPDAAPVHYSLGMAYRGLGRLEQAHAHLSRRGMSGLRPADPLVDALATLLRGERAQMTLARRAYDAGQFQEASAAFAKAVEAAPASAEARLGLGMALAQMGNAASAVEQLEIALRLDADNTTAHTTLGLILARLGRESDAVDHLFAAFRQEPADQTAGPLIRLLLKLSRGNEALDVLSRSRSLSVDDEATVLGVSILLADREQHREAIELLDSAHRQFSDRVRTATTLARMLAASPDRSLRDGVRALTLAMRVYEQERSPVHGETVAMALAELGRCGEAAAWMQRAIVDAERGKDTATAARLRGEAPRYAGAACRP
jgi:tetratricopeptide (TPR) repeat protein